MKPSLGTVATFYSLHMGGILFHVVGCKELSGTGPAVVSSWVTARVACSGRSVGSVRMAVVVLRRRRELRTTEDAHRECGQKENVLPKKKPKKKSGQCIVDSIQ